MLKFKEKDNIKIRSRLRPNYVQQKFNYYIESIFGRYLIGRQNAPYDIYAFDE